MVERCVSVHDLVSSGFGKFAESAHWPVRECTVFDLRFDSLPSSKRGFVLTTVCFPYRAKFNESFDGSFQLTAGDQFIAGTERMFAI